MRMQTLFDDVEFDFSWGRFFFLEIEDQRNRELETIRKAFMSVARAISRRRCIDQYRF